MSDEVFRQTRRRVTPEDLGDTPAGDPMASVRSVQEAVAAETGKEPTRSVQNAPFEIQGNIPPALRQALEQRQMTPVQQAPTTPSPQNDDGFEAFEAPAERPRPQSRTNPLPSSPPKLRVTGSDALEDLLQKLAGGHTWEEFVFPSKSKFYSDIPPMIHVRPMTGEEEQILATPRWVKKGKAIDMIFRRCIQEQIDTENLLSTDRTHLLIYLRGISYTPEYDVEVKCPNCSTKFAHVIDLNEMEVENCPDDFGPDNLHGVLPQSGFRYSYRLATGQDEQEISDYREKRIKQWGDQGEDDTLLYRTALLLEEIQGVTMKKELALLLKKLPILDVAHLRNEINTPPFGVDTELPILCPSCSEEFKIDLPLETNFFFPRKKTTGQA